MVHGGGRKDNEGNRGDISLNGTSGEDRGGWKGCKI